jgi:hypothetical protein
MLCLVLSSSATDAWSWYLQAWKIHITMFREDVSYERLARNLVNEMGVFLQQQSATSWLAQMNDYLELVPESLTQLDSVLKVKVIVDLQNKNYNSAIATLSNNCFPTYATDRDDLMSYWNLAVRLYYA